MATKVLVVDDNICLSSLLQQMLEENGFEVNAAADSREAYMAFLLDRPDVILTDIHMPGGNGLEMMKRIRTLNPEVRTIYMSGDCISFQSAIQEEEKKFHARFLRKPFSGDDLIKLLSECVNPHGKTAAERVQPFWSSEHYPCASKMH